MNNDLNYLKRKSLSDAKKNISTQDFVRSFYVYFLSSTKSLLYKYNKNFFVIGLIIAKVPLPNKQRRFYVDFSPCLRNEASVFLSRKNATDWRVAKPAPMTRKMSGEQLDPFVDKSGPFLDASNLSYLDHTLINDNGPYLSVLQRNILIIFKYRLRRFKFTFRL